MELIQNVEIEKSLYFDNVASFRKKMNHSEINKEVESFINYLKRKGFEKKGPIITATFSMEIINGIQVLDIEFLIPVNRFEQLTTGYTMKRIFHLKNAVFIRHIGNPGELEPSYNRLTSYIIENGLQQITVAYNVNVNQEEVFQGKQPIIDIYIGVNPSIL